MAEANIKLQGLFGNDRFMDHLYRYGEISAEINDKLKLQNSEKISEEIEKDRQKCAMHRVSSINICLHQIKSMTPYSDEWTSYFNYIRWNHKAIVVELNSYLQHPCMEKHRETISVCSEHINYVLKEFCNFTNDDQTIIREYRHAFEMITNPRKQKPQKLLLQAGKLFANFINILTKRYCYEDTADIQFDDVKMQADVIIEKLSSKCLHQQAETVKNLYENFVNLTKMQAAHRSFHNNTLKTALKLTHARATESLLNEAKRIIQNTIAKIREKLRDGLQTVITVGSAVIYPIMHPIRTGGNILNFIWHPVQSTKALVAWAKLNPWKCCALVTGALVLGGIGFGTTAFLFDMFVFDFTTRVLPLYLIGSVSSIFGVVANKANALIQVADSDEFNVRTEFRSFERNLNAKGERIVSHALDETNNDWWTLIDGFEDQRQAQINQQIDALDEKQLVLVEREQSEYLPTIDSELVSANKVIEEITVSVNRDLDDELVLQRAEEILRKKIAAADSFDWQR